jgi:hypothetical protein
MHGIRDCWPPGLEQEGARGPGESGRDSFECERQFCCEPSARAHRKSGMSEPASEPSEQRSAVSMGWCRFRRHPITTSNSAGHSTLQLTPGPSWSFPNSITPQGKFVDHLNSGGVGPGFYREGDALQEFTATGWFGSQALDIFFGGSSVDGVSMLYMTSGGVIVNGQGSYQSCGK